MRVLIYEHLTAQNPGGDDPMTREGRAMRDAVAADFGAFAEVELAPLTEAGRFDWVLVIAPETDGVLEGCVRAVFAAGGRAVNCSIDAIRLCGDKLELARLWNAVGVLTPPIEFLAPIGAAASSPGRKPRDHHQLLPARGLRPGLLAAAPSGLRVVKPRFGCGSTATTLVHSEVELAAAERDGEMIVQEYVPGVACSVAVLCGPAWRVPLLPATQDLSADGRFRYRGGVIPLSSDLANRAVVAAMRAVGCVPGMFGYVGVDLVLGDAGDYAIEINPRLSTSYVGLRILAETNLAAAMIAAAEPVLKWKPGTVRFTAAGAVTREPEGPRHGG